MGDEPPSGRQPALTNADKTGHSRASQGAQTSMYTQTIQQQGMEFDNYPVQHAAIPQMPTGSSLNMGHMANSLVDYRHSNYAAQPLHPMFPVPGSTNPAALYQYQQAPQYVGQGRTNYNPAIASQYSNVYNPSQNPRMTPQSYVPVQGYLASHGQGQPQFTMQSYYPNHQQAIQAHPNPYAQANPSLQGLQSGMGQYSPDYAVNSNLGLPPDQIRQDGMYLYAQSVQPGPEHFISGSTHSGSPYLQPGGQSLSRHSSESSIRLSIPRGPPRKPKQSGHALWVGNLPPGTQIVDLKDHFSREATKDIESVFLISKSNCAFVNYKTEAACAAAMTRFHDSRFQGVRLVCRLRRGSGTSPSGTSTTAAGGSVTAEATDSSANPSEQEDNQEVESDIVVASKTSGASSASTVKVKEKFFIVKSLTVEDLELSVRNGIWTTQAHNEAALNKAYERAENVYLIFSANKSGEYFGYARMISPIDDEAVTAIDLPARSGPITSVVVDLPTTVFTNETATAPKGRIIDDSARGTIFWEAEVDSDAEESKTDESRTDVAVESDDPDNLSPETPQTFGKPFKVAWMSTERLPFFRTRGLRNPWNANREVKIARDGTELEPGVGRRLVNMFHKPQNMASPAASRAPVLQPGPYMVGMGYMPQLPTTRSY